MCPCPHTLLHYVHSHVDGTVYNIEEKSHSGIYMETYTTCVGYRYK